MEKKHSSPGRQLAAVLCLIGVVLALLLSKVGVDPREGIARTPALGAKDVVPPAIAMSSAADLEVGADNARVRLRQDNAELEIRLRADGEIPSYGVEVSVAGADASLTRSVGASSVRIAVPPGVYRVSCNSDEWRAAPKWVVCSAGEWYQVDVHLEKRSMRELLVETVAPNGVVIPGATVEVLDEDGGTIGRPATTDMNGLATVAISDRWLGSGSLIAKDAGGGQGRRRLPHEREAVESRLRIVVGPPCRLTITLKPAGATVGYVGLRLAEGRPDREMAVRPWKRAAVRGEDGKWVVEGVAPGRYVVVASGPGLAELWVENEYQPGCIAASRPTVELDGRDIQMDLWLTETFELAVERVGGGELSVLALDSTREGTDPLSVDEGVLIEELDRLGEIASKVGNQRVRGQDRVVLTGLRRGRYWVGLQGGGSAAWRNVSIPETKHVQWTAPSATGTVVGVADAERIIRASRDGERRSFRADSNGEFRAPGMTEGKWELRCVEVSAIAQVCLVIGGQTTHVRLCAGGVTGVPVSGSLQGVGAGRIAINGHTIPVDSEGRFLGLVGSVGAGEARVWWRFSGESCSVDGESAIKHGDLTPSLQLTEVEWRAPVGVGQVVEVLAWLMEGTGDVRHARYSWGQEPVRSRVVRGRYRIAMKRLDGVTAVCEAVTDEVGTRLIVREWEGIVLRLRYGNGAPFAGGEVATTSASVGRSVFSCDENGEIRLGGVSGEVSVFARGRNGRREFVGVTWVKDGVANPETLIVQ